MKPSEHANLDLPGPLCRQLLQRLYAHSARVPRSRWQRVKHRLFTRASRLVLRIADPLLEHQVGGAPLLMPFSHRLPMYLQWHPRYSSNLARLARHVADKYPDLTLVDVGANIGDTVAIVRTTTLCPILCIEGDSGFFPVLQANAARFTDVEIVRAFLGERHEEILAQSLQAHGTAHLSAAGTGNSFSVYRLDVLLKDFPQFENSKLVKTDTDGYDAKVLRGDEQHLVAVKPALFFEYDPYFLSQQNDDPLALLRWLEVLGYSKLIFYDNFGELLLDTDANNYRQLEELTLYFTGHQAQRYCDVCAFHRIDEDVFEKMIAAEIELFRTERVPRH